MMFEVEEIIIRQGRFRYLSDKECMFTWLILLYGSILHKININQYHLDSNDHHNDKIIKIVFCKEI